MFTVKICYWSNYRESFSVESYGIKQINDEVCELTLRPKIISESPKPGNYALIMEIREATIYVENPAGKTVDTIHLTSEPE